MSRLLARSWQILRRFDRASLHLVLLAVGAAVAVYQVKGEDAALAALRRTLDMLIDIMPAMAGAVLLAGLMQVLVPRDLVTRWMGSGSGLRGLFVATVAGALTPAGPMAAFPLAAAFLTAGADFGSATAYLVAWSVLGINRIIVWDIPVMGTDFTVVRLLATVPLSFIAGLIARRLIGMTWSGAPGQPPEPPKP